MGVFTDRKYLFMMLLLNQYNMAKEATSVDNVQPDLDTTVQDTTVIKEDDMTEEQTVFNGERALPGIYIDDQSLTMRQVRNALDILDNSVRKYMGDPEVDTWLKQVGGINKLDEILLGGRKQKKLHIQRLRYLRDQLGYQPSPLGQEQWDKDSEPLGTTWGQVVHRAVTNKKAHGELKDPENSTPDWHIIQMESDASKKSNWLYMEDKRIFFPKGIWSKVHPAGWMKRATNKTNRLVQVETSTNEWRQDIRISKTFDAPKGYIEYNHVWKFMPWFQAQDNTVVKEFINRFYNEPQKLFWKKRLLGSGERAYQVWTACMRMPKGDLMWCPVSRKSNSLIDWWIKLDQEGEKDNVWYCRALYTTRGIIAYQKDKTKDDHIHVRWMKEDSQSGWLVVIREESMHWKDWASMKKTRLKQGAIDAQLGRPWAITVPKDKYYTSSSPF